METEKLTRSAILSSMLIILSIIFIGTGIGGQFYLEFIVPVIIAIIYLQCGFKWAVLASVNTILSIALGLGRMTASVWMIQSVLLGVLAGYLLTRKSLIMDDLVMASVAGCFIMLFMDYFLRLLTGVSILDPVDFWGFAGYKELEEVIYYLGIASIPIGTMAIVYACSLFLGKRLNILTKDTRMKYKVVRRFFKYRPYVFCSRKVVSLSVIYLIITSYVSYGEIAYIKALLISTRYILLYFVVADCWGIITQWCYIKTKSAFVTNGMLILMIVAMVNYFKGSLYVLIGLGILMDYQIKIREKQKKILNYLIKN